MKSQRVILMLLMTVCIGFITVHQAQCGEQQHLKEGQLPQFKMQQTTNASITSSYIGFDFNAGNCEGWTVYGPLDEDGDGPGSILITTR